MVFQVGLLDIKNRDVAEFMTSGSIQKRCCLFPVHGDRAIRNEIFVPFIRRNLTELNKYTRNESNPS